MEYTVEAHVCVCVCVYPRDCAKVGYCRLDYTVSFCANEITRLGVFLFNSAVTAHMQHTSNNITNEHAPQIPILPTSSQAMDECVSSCQHPLWGGDGVCVENDEGDGLDRHVGEEEYFCSCDAGFVSRDSYGTPSCVREWPQLLIYATAVAVHIAGAFFLAWHIVQHCNLPDQARTSRRATIRLRLTISTR